jgi:hypothetical protein
MQRNLIVKGVQILDPFGNERKSFKRIDIESKEDLYYARNRVQVLLWIFKKLPES